MFYDKKEKIRKMPQESPCLCFNMRKASRIVTQIYEQALKSTGYTPSQIMILSGIKELHSANINELAEALSIDRTTLSRNLIALRKDSLIKPCDCADRRAKAIMLTDKGADVLLKASVLWNQKHANITKAVGSEHMKDFISNLNEILAVVQKV